MKNNKYLIEVDFVIFACLVLIACIIIWIVGILIQRNEQFNALQYTTISLVHSANVYDIQKHIINGQRLTIKQLNDAGVTTKIINPFDSTAYCNEDTSFVEKKDGHIYVTLNCGNYWVIDYSSKISKSMKIYRESSFGNTLVKEINMKESDNDETK